MPKPALTNLRATKQSALPPPQGVRCLRSSAQPQKPHSLQAVLKATGFDAPCGSGRLRETEAALAEARHEAACAASAAEDARAEVAARTADAQAAGSLAAAEAEAAEAARAGERAARRDAAAAEELQRAAKRCGSGPCFYREGPRSTAWFLKAVLAG